MNEFLKPYPPLVTLQRQLQLSSYIDKIALKFTVISVVNLDTKAHRFLAKWRCSRALKSDSLGSNSGSITYRLGDHGLIISVLYALVFHLQSGVNS